MTGAGCPIHALGLAGVLAVATALAPAAATRSRPTAGDSTPDAAPEPAATARVDRKRLLPHERLRLVLTLDTPAGMDGTLPAVGPTLGPWRVVAITPREARRSPAGGMRRSAELLLEPFLPGEYRVPTLEFTVRDEEGSPARTLRTESISVTVGSVLGPDATADVGPERGVIDSVDTHTGLWWAMGLAGGVVVLSAGGAIVLLRRMRRQPVPLPPQWKIARLELERALAQFEWRDGQAARALDAAARTLSGWRLSHEARLAEDGPMADPADERLARRAAADALESQLDVLRFSGGALDPGAARRLGEDLMRLTTPAAARTEPVPAHGTPARREGRAQ